MLTVHTLGTFRLEFEQYVLREDDIRSPMLTKLLSFLLVNHYRRLGAEELIDALWQQDEVDNPAGALKNLMYRLRSFLKKEFGRDDFILTISGSYQWNPQIPLSLDAEEFGRLINDARALAQNQEDPTELYKNAVDLYRGDFIPQISDMHWALTLNAYLHSLYLECLRELSEHYVHQKRYVQLEQLCMSALSIDGTDETIYYYLILSRARQYKIKLALQTYEVAVKTLNRELDVHHSAKLSELYEQILQTAHGGRNADIGEVQSVLSETDTCGAFFCGYPVFREMYRLENRNCIRRNDTSYVVLFTIEAASERATDKIYQFRVSTAMGHLKKILQESLRMGDVVSKYNESQYLILLPSCDYEGAMLVANRVTTMLKDVKFVHNSLRVRVDAGQVTSASICDAVAF
jgi:DNA-binding SARP family transcriptional activator